MLPSKLLLDASHPRCGSDAQKQRSHDRHEAGKDVKRHEVPRTSALCHVIMIYAKRWLRTHVGAHPCRHSQQTFGTGGSTKRLAGPARGDRAG